MSSVVPDISEYIRMKKVQSVSTTNDTLSPRKTRSVVPYAVTGASLRIRRLPRNALAPLKVVAPALVPIPTPTPSGPTAPSAPATVTFTSLGTFNMSASWSTVSGATSYTLRLYQSASTTVTLQNSTVAYTFENAVSGSTFSLPQSYDDTKYFAVGVNAIGPGGTSSVALSATRISPPTFPPVITLTKPVSDGMVITWTGAARAASYTVRIYSGASSAVSTSDTLVGTYTDAVSGTKFSFTPVTDTFYTATITSINATGTSTSDVTNAGYVRYTLTNTADYNYQFRVGNLQPTVLHGATAYDTGTANVWKIRLRKTDYDGDNLTSVLTTALDTAGTIVLQNIANAGQKLTFTGVTYIVNAYDHFEIVGTKDGANSTLLLDNTIIKVTITAAESPPVEYVYAASAVFSAGGVSVDPGSGNVKFFSPGGPINVAISRTNKAGVDVSTWLEDTGTVGQKFKLEGDANPLQVNFTATILSRNISNPAFVQYDLSSPLTQTLTGTVSDVKISFVPPS